MYIVLLAALLSGTALSTISYSFVALIGAPVWLGYKTFFLTWITDVTAMILGLTFLNLILSRIPVKFRPFRDGTTRFFWYCCLSLGIGVLSLTLLVAKDVQNVPFWGTLLVVTGAISLPTMFIVKVAVRKAPEMFVRVMATSLILILAANGVYWAVDQQYTAQIKERSSHFRGTIPHLLLLVLDTARGDHFSCNGYPFSTTPNMDRIASEGLNCTNAYSASNWTPPGHISIFTGKYPDQHGNDGKPFMPDDLLSLTEVLNQQGYYCVSMYENPLAGKDINLTQGFDYDFGVLHSSWIYTIPLRLWDKLIYNDDGAYVTFATARKVCEYVEQRGGHLFLYINVVEPHLPYRINQPYFSQFTENLDMSKVGDLSRIQFLCRPEPIIIQDSTRFVGLTDESLAYVRAIYDSELAYDDMHFGRLADWMKSSGMLDRTLLIVTADHGEVIGEHLTMGHRYTLFEPCIQIPLIMHHRASIKPIRLEENVSNVDVFPTALMLMGFEDKIPLDVAGVNLLNLPSNPNRPIISSNPDPRQISIFEGSYKLILNQDTSLRKYALSDTSLYDLNDDPTESTNLHAIQPVRSDRLLVQINDWVDNHYVAAKDSIRVSQETLENMRALGYVH